MGVILSTTLNLVVDFLNFFTTMTDCGFEHRLEWCCWCSLVKRQIVFSGFSCQNYVNYFQTYTCEVFDTSSVNGDVLSLVLCDDISMIISRRRPRLLVKAWKRCSVQLCCAIPQKYTISLYESFWSSIMFSSFIYFLLWNLTSDWFRS